MLNYSQYADWIIDEVGKTQPSGSVTFEKIANNKLTMKIERGGHTLRFRVLLYAVGAAGRSNPLERRVEITSTYSGGLVALSDHVDVVLGVEREKRLLVGIDHRRLAHGGPTHNASTFVYLPSFDKLVADGWFPMRTSTQLFESEYQIYFRPSFLLDYLKQHESLHNSGIGQPPSTAVEEDIVDQLEGYSVDGSTTTLSYEQQLELALKKMQVGRIGESIVLQAEIDHLMKVGAPNLAKKVDWVSQVQPYLGYDIASFRPKVKKEYVEVKASVRELNRFYFTANEMKVAGARGDSYRLVCVSNVMTQPTLREFRNPIKAISDGILEVERDTSLVAIKK